MNQFQEKWKKLIDPFKKKTVQKIKIPNLIQNIRKKLMNQFQEKYITNGLTDG